MAEDNVEGATPNERLLYAARYDDDEILSEVFSKPKSFDINFRDGIGNTALHYAASCGSLDVLNELLEYEAADDDEVACDVDLTNIKGETPLHLAVNYKEPELRALIVDSLLDAGADTSIKDKTGKVALDYVPEDDEETRKAFRRQEVMRNIPTGDIVYDDDDDYSESDEE